MVGASLSCDKCGILFRAFYEFTILKRVLHGNASRLYALFKFSAFVIDKLSSFLSKLQNQEENTIITFTFFFSDFSLSL